ncbi:hypothetical protein STEG23_034110, partial [Scotinomys teguina]
RNVDFSARDGPVHPLFTGIGRVHHDFPKMKTLSDPLILICQDFPGFITEGLTTGKSSQSQTNKNRWSSY